MPNLLKSILIRSALALLIAYAVAQLLPATSISSMYAAVSVVPVSVLLGVIFLRALKRHEDLSEWISIELNKLRRVYHLGKNLSGDDTRLRQWFTDLHGFLTAYLTAFDKKDFSRYQETNGEFRKLSYHLYTVADLNSEKERVLYRELLEAAGLVAGSRQRIQELWNGGLSDKTWNAVTFVAALSGLAIVISVGRSDWFVGGLLLAVMFASAYIVRNVDQMRNLSGEALSKRYVENLARLELKRH